MHCKNNYYKITNTKETLISNRLTNYLKGPLSLMRDLVAISLPPHACCLFLSSQPLLFHASHSPPLHTPSHCNDWQKARSFQLPNPRALLGPYPAACDTTLSLVVDIPLSWSSSPTGLFLLYLFLRLSSSKNTLNVVFQGSWPPSLFSCYTPFANFIHSGVLAIFDVSAYSSELWAKF